MSLRSHVKYMTNIVKCKIFPCQFDRSKYQNTFLENDYPPFDIQTPVTLPRKIFVFWTGTNELTENRKRCLTVLKQKSGIEIVLISPENLHHYILPEHPLHPAYPYLSLVHKSDYLRCYLMNFYGGGYSDIKECRYNWVPFFEQIEASNAFIIGYPECKKRALPQVKEKSIQHDMNAYFSQLLGNGAYICRPNTPFTNEWYHELMHRMDHYQDQLKQCSGNILGDNEGYPIPWSNILGEIFHPLCLKHSKYLLRNSKLKPVCKNYR